MPKPIKPKPEVVKPEVVEVAKPSQCGACGNAKAGGKCVVCGN